MHSLNIKIEDDSYAELKRILAAKGEASGWKGAEDCAHYLLDVGIGRTLALLKFGRGKSNGKSAAPKKAKKNGAVKAKVRKAVKRAAKK